MSQELKHKSVKTQNYLKYLKNILNIVLDLKVTQCFTNYVALLYFIFNLHNLGLQSV